MPKKYYQSVDSKNKNEFFKSQKIVAEDLYSLIGKHFDIKNKSFKVLDPCCGDGALDDFDNQNLSFTLFDIDRKIENCEECDFLKKENFLKNFDFVIMNPPFKFLNDFIEKAFTYSDNIFLIAPLRKTIKKYKQYIKDYCFNWRYSYSYGVLATIGIFYLKKEKLNFNKLLFKELYPLVEVEKTLKSLFKREDSLSENKPFIAFRATKARLVRGENLIKESDIFNAGDDSVFKSEASNTFVKKGQKVFRYICYFDSLEECFKFKNLFEKHDEAIRSYATYYSSNLSIDLEDFLNPYFL